METIRTVWMFFQNQILGMQWLNGLIGGVLTRLGVSLESTMGGALQFFIYDTIKIFVLLSVLIFGISYIQSYFPPERTKKILGRFHGIVANAAAALLGTVTPEKGSKAQAAGCLCGNLYGWHHCGGLYVQCNPVPAGLTARAVPAGQKHNRNM